jgi:UDP-N-acetylmuramyl pentapeptide phosphotransferase/UDP-N-acetylglucosamine-1-phosphate transferase
LWLVCIVYSIVVVAVMWWNEWTVQPPALFAVFGFLGFYGVMKDAFKLEPLGDGWFQLCCVCRNQS